MPVEIIERDLGWREIKREMIKMNNSTIDVGLFSSGGGPDVSMASRATVHEFGSPKRNIPKRPFMRQTFDNNLNAYVKVISRWMSQILADKISPKMGFAKIGEWYTGRMKLQITKGSFTSLKPTTVKAKKSTKPLIDTGQMRGQITHKERMR